MKKNIEIIIYIIITIIMIVLFLIAPFSFFDTSDLICSKVVDTGSFKTIDERVISFDKKANIKQIIEKNIIEYKDEETAKKEYERITSEQELSSKIELQGKRLVGESIEVSIEHFVGYGKSKKEVKEYYEKEFNYICGKE